MNDKLTGSNKDLRRKLRQAQSQLNCLVDERAELQVSSILNWLAQKIPGWLNFKLVGSKDPRVAQFQVGWLKRSQGGSFLHLERQGVWYWVRT